MLGAPSTYRYNLVIKLITAVGATLLLSISIWAVFNVRHTKNMLMASNLEGADRLTNTIRLGTHFAMMLNSRDDINQIIKNISRQPEIETIRIYNKSGEIKFSNDHTEVGRFTNIKDEACYICHRTEPPQTALILSQRSRIFESKAGDRYLGIISPIYNEPGCATGDCHVHPENKHVLGALDVVMSLKTTDAQIQKLQRGVIFMAGFTFLTTSAILFVFVLRFINRPIRKLVRETRRISEGDYSGNAALERNDELGYLGAAINRMGRAIGQKEAELERRKDEYQSLFEGVPCIVTVQNRDYRLLRYNREFSDLFDPQPGDFCYHAYKGRTEKCVVCPVERTFEDGEVHYSEEQARNRDGTMTHWIVRTSPIKNTDGEIVAAMEMSLDVTQTKFLEQQLAQTEKKYYAFFNNIPNPVFVLDAETLRIIDCNDPVTPVYGYAKEAIIDRPFSEFFLEDERDDYVAALRTETVLDRVRHLTRNDRIIFVNIRISPAEYGDRKVILVTTSDITKRLEAEQQLTQASKMATLGEMATGVAHELNQPLTVIKTASSYLAKKLGDGSETDPVVKMVRKISTNIDRASRIITHMRQFARKSEIRLEAVGVNEVLEKAYEMFSQQLKVRGIEVDWDLGEDIPPIQADPGRLEQVFINLLINARDAIEERLQRDEGAERRIHLATLARSGTVTVRICDTGIGISPAVAEKMFEPFFTTKEVGKGTGLGLSISYGIVKDFRGDIWVEPEFDGGTCFVLRFPVRETR